MSVNLIFNGVRVPEYIKITKVDTQVLPSSNLIQTNNISTHNRYKNKVEKNRVVNAEFKIIDNALVLEDEKLREFYRWLRGNDFKESKLEIPSLYKNSYYMAVVENEVEISKDGTTKSGSIVFNCINPYRYSKDISETSTPISNRRKKLTVGYRGDIANSPKITIKVLNECEEIKINFKSAKKINCMKLIGKFTKNDVITIDCNTNKVYLNNNLNMQILTLDSRFHKLDEGDNEYEVLVSPKLIADTQSYLTLSVQYNEIYGG